MSKDPAFLFYSQAFYESTRMMLPEERACYIDLLIYQHQNGPIPIDSSRLHLYCTGVVNEVVNQVLNQRFNQTEQGWVNKKMEKVMTERKVRNPRKIAYATLAGLLSAKQLSEKKAYDVKKEFIVDDFIEYEKDEMKQKIRDWFYEVVNVFVNNNKDKTKDKDKSIDIVKGGKTVEVWPTFDDFWDAYDKKVGSREKISGKWKDLKQADKEIIMQYIPLYKSAQPNKKYRKNPETFLNSQGWNDEIIPENGNQSKKLKFDTNR